MSRPMPPAPPLTSSCGSSRRRCAPSWSSARWWRRQRSRSAGRFSSGLGSIRRRGEAAGLHTGPAGRWTYTPPRCVPYRGGRPRRAGLRLLGPPPTVTVVVLIAVLLLIVLGLIELIGRPPAQPGPAPPVHGVVDPLIIGLAITVPPTIVALILILGAGRPRKQPSWMTRLDRLSPWAATGLGACSRGRWSCAK
jgi:hypothetical protein